MNAAGVADPARDILVKGLSADPVYALTSTGRRWVPNKGTFEWLGYSLGNVRRLPDADLARIPEEAPLPAARARLVKSASDPRTYMVTQAGAKRWIPDTDTFHVLNLAWADIQTVSAGELDAMPVAPNCDHLTDSSWLSTALGALGDVAPFVGAAVGTIFGAPQAGAALGGAVRSGIGASGAGPSGPDTFAPVSYPTTPGAALAPLYGTRWETFPEWAEREWREIV